MPKKSPRCLYQEGCSCGAPEQKLAFCLPCLVSSLMQSTGCLVENCVRNTRIPIKQAAHYYEHLIDIITLRQGITKCLQQSCPDFYELPQFADSCSQFLGLIKMMGGNPKQYIQ